MDIINEIKDIATPYSEADTLLLSEIAFNLLYGNIPLSESDLAYFKTQKPVLRKLAAEKLSWQSKRRLLTDEFVKRLKAAALNHLDG